MKKLTGSDTIVLMKSAMNNKEVLAEVQTLTQSDFDTDDLLVNYFFQVYPKGFASANFNDTKTVTAMTDKMQSIKKEVAVAGLRKAHNLLQNVRCADNRAVILENQVNEVTPESGIESQVKAAQLVSFLSKYVDGNKYKTILASAENNINSGNLKEASAEIREVFSDMHPDTNVKTAAQTLRNTMGEAFQLCPKGIFISGAAEVMPVSNCRDYCVDVKINRDGTVGCNYVKWLNENLVTQEQALNLRDNIHDKVHDVQETMNLEKGQRTKFPMSDQDFLDKRVHRDEDLTKEITTESWESKLSKSHDKAKEKVTKLPPMASDKAIELLLKDVRDIFDDEDLDALEAQIREAVGE